jgi:hypothetical protein
MIFVSIVLIVLISLIVLMTYRIEGFEYPAGVYECNDSEDCIDISYNDVNNNIQHIKGRISPNYYVNEDGVLTEVPEGNIANPDRKSYSKMIELSGNIMDIGNSKTDDVLNTSYQDNNYDITYHKDFEEDQETWVLDNSGNMKSLPYYDVKHTTLYYDPEEVKYDQSNYTPNYQESVWLSIINNNYAK